MLGRRSFLASLSTLLVWWKTPPAEGIAIIRGPANQMDTDRWRDGDVIPEHLTGLFYERMIMAGLPMGALITAELAEQHIPKARYSPRVGLFRG